MVAPLEVDGTKAIDELLPLLQRLDQLLEYAISVADATYGSTAATDPYRGLHISQEEVERSLSQQPANPLFPRSGAIAFPSELIAEGSRLSWLQQTFELSNFDLDVVAIALAPELDRRYERLYAYLQDDVRCKRPSVDLALNLLCPTAATKLARRTHFTPDAPLIQHNLVHLEAEGDRGKPTLLARELHLDEQVVRFLLQQPGLDPRLSLFCQLIQPSVFLNNHLLSAEIRQALSALVIQDWQQKKKASVVFPR